MSIQHKDTWNGSCSGVSYEIIHWGKTSDGSGINDGNGMWNYYIYINQEQLSEEDFNKIWLPVDRWWDRSNGRKQPQYDEYNSILSCGDFHGGITHYSKYECPDEKYKYIKVGCDYGHLWDQEIGYPYNIASVEIDAKHSIKQLAEVLRFKIRCFYMGSYDYPENMVLLENGSYISHEGQTKRLENAA